METIIDEGGFYKVDVYYDFLDDFECLYTVYSFRTKEIAEQFIEQVPFVCADIDYQERPRTDDGHAKTHPFRPIFTTLEDAIADAKEFNKHGWEKEYKYSGRVFKEDLSVIEKQYDKNTIKKLTKENDELKKKISLLEIELQSIKS
jgi:hypothetical protein